LFSSALLFVGVLAALVAMLCIRAKAPKEDKPDVSLPTTIVGWMSGGLFPVVFCVAWWLIHVNQTQTGVVVATRTPIEHCHPFEVEIWKAQNPLPVLQQPSKPNASTPAPQAGALPAPEGESGGQGRQAPK
jgi:hypothetical protein